MSLFCLQSFVGQEEVVIARKKSETGQLDPENIKKHVNLTNDLLQQHFLVFLVLVF